MANCLSACWEILSNSASTRVKVTPVHKLLPVPVSHLKSQNTRAFQPPSSCHGFCYPYAAYLLCGVLPAISLPTRFFSRQTSITSCHWFLSSTHYVSSLRWIIYSVYGYLLFPAKRLSVDCRRWSIWIREIQKFGLVTKIKARERNVQRTRRFKWLALSHPQSRQPRQSRRCKTCLVGNQPRFPDHKQFGKATLLISFFFPYVIVFVSTFPSLALDYDWPVSTSL